MRRGALAIFRQHRPNEDNDIMRVEEQIRANAERTIRAMGPISGIEAFGCNADSVKWVEGFIERQRVRPELDEDATDRLVSNLGPYLGACVIAYFGGAWRQQDGMWGVALNPGNAVFPFNKVRKQFDNGIEDGIYCWFDSIPIVFAKYVKAAVGYMGNVG